MGVDDHHRDAHPWSGVDVVLAGHDVGPQPADLRSEPRPAGSVRNQGPGGRRLSSEPSCWAFTARPRGSAHKLITLTPFAKKIYGRMSLLQYVVMQTFLITMLALPVKILLRLVFPNQVCLGDALV